MNTRVKVWITTTALLLLAQPGFADDKTALPARLKKAEIDTSLDDKNLLPWHLKLEIQFYDLKGKPTDKGTIEEWWATPRQRLIEYALPDYTGKFVQNDKGEFWSKTPGSPSNLANMLLTQIVHPMPGDEKIDRATPELRKDSFGKVSLDCIMLTHPIKDVVYPPLGLYPTYCFDVGKDSLRVSYSLGSIGIVRNSMGVFQGRSVATAVTIDQGSTQTASAHVVELKGTQVVAGQFAESPDMQSTLSKASVPGTVMAGTILKKPQPIYPQSARMRHAEGTVLLHALIGRDGRILTLEIDSTPDADLGLAALAAVQQWAYSPYLINGQPTEVDTIITVNFHIGLR